MKIETNTVEHYNGRGDTRIFNINSIFLSLPHSFSLSVLDKLIKANREIDQSLVWLRTHSCIIHGMRECEKNRYFV